MKFFIFFVLFLFNIKNVNAHVTTCSEAKPIEPTTYEIGEACHYIVPAYEWGRQIKMCYDEILNERVL